MLVVLGEALGVPIRRVLFRGILPFVFDGFRGIVNRHVAYPVGHMACC